MATIKPHKVIVEEYLRIIDDRVSNPAKYFPISTTIHDLDVALNGGFPNVGYVIIKAQPNVGKTTYLYQFAQYASRIVPKKKILMVIIEESPGGIDNLSDPTIMDRYVSRKTGISRNSLTFAKFSKQEAERIKECAIGSIETGQNIYYASVKSVDDLKSAFEKVNPDIFIVDYVQALAMGENPVLANATLSIWLNSLKYNHLVVVAAQINSDATIKWSSNYEQDAGVIVLMKKMIDAETSKPIPNHITLEVTKSRQSSQTASPIVARFNGSTGVIETSDDDINTVD